MLVVLVLREAQASVGHEMCRPRALAELDEQVRANRPACRDENVTQNILSGVQVVDDELCGNSFFLTSAKNSLTKSEHLQKSRRKSKGRTENSPVEKRSWGLVKLKTMSFGRKPSIAATPRCL